MARAQGNDLAEIFGYAPDDPSQEARRQWKSQECPFVGDTPRRAEGVSRAGLEAVEGKMKKHVWKPEGTSGAVTDICGSRLYVGTHNAHPGELIWSYRGIASEQVCEATELKAAKAEALRALAEYARRILSAVEGK